MGLLLSYAFLALIWLGLLLVWIGGAVLVAVGAAWFARRLWVARGGNRLVLPVGAFVLAGLGVALLAPASMGLWIFGQL